MKRIDEYDAYIFDVDGTLYNQKKMHIYMLIKLVIYYFFHLKDATDLFVIWRFRKYREKEQYKEYSICELDQLIAQNAKMDYLHVKNVIEKWMFVAPLNILPRCCYRDMIRFIRQQSQNGKIVYIYSDYPAKEKVDLLGLSPTRIISSEDKYLHELKPSKKVMQFIVNEIGCPVKNILYIGDRDEKDGKSAYLVGIDYMDVKKFRRCLKC